MRQFRQPEGFLLYSVCGCGALRTRGAAVDPRLNQLAQPLLGAGHGIATRPRLPGPADEIVVRQMLVQQCEIAPAVALRVLDLAANLSADLPSQAISIGARPQRGCPGMLWNVVCWPAKIGTLRSMWPAPQVLPGTPPPSAPRVTWGRCACMSLPWVSVRRRAIFRSRTDRATRSMWPAAFYCFSSRLTSAKKRQSVHVALTG